jgi:hypothetical protein
VSTAACVERVEAEGRERREAAGQSDEDELTPVQRQRKAAGCDGAGQQPDDETADQVLRRRFLRGSAP